MIAIERLEAIIVRSERLKSQMNAVLLPERFIALSKEYSTIHPIVDAIVIYRDMLQEIEDMQFFCEGDDIEMQALANAELLVLMEKLPIIEHELIVLMLPKDSADDLNVILEVRAGTGGDEAALFAGDLFRMYYRYAELHGFQVDHISASVAEMGGYKEIVIAIRGQGVFARLKFESGVHRVQRIPETESSGRVHTSAATVAVLPEPEDVDVTIDEKDLRIDVFRASGPGGQSVNTTDSAVRITHLPTGLVVSQQDEKSQHKNKAKAMQVLRARLFEAERHRIDSERSENRKLQVGSGDRSQRIRTYNYPQGRVTDHRINLTLHKLDKIIIGEALDEIIDVLLTEEQSRRLVEMGDTGCV